MVIALVSLFASVHAFGASEIKFPVHLDRSGFELGIWDVGPCYVSGQPSEDAFRQLAKEGVKTVVCIRTQQELNDRKQVPFDEVALLKELNIKFVHIPIGGPDTYNPDSVHRFADALEHADSKVLLHCTVAWRASYMWTAYLYLHKHYSFDEMVKVGEAMYVTGNRPEALLGIKMSYVVTPHRDGARVPANKTYFDQKTGLQISTPKVVNAPVSGRFNTFVMWDLGSILNAGQPDESKLRELAAQGVKTVINIRTVQEMEDLKKNGFDEEALAKQLGLDYVLLPIQKFEEFTPEYLRKFGDQMAKAKGKILVHCQSANRTTNVLVAYLVRYLNVDLDEAMKIGESMRLSNNWSELLGVDVAYKIKPKSGV